MSKIKIKFKGIELEKIESDKVLCFGCKQEVPLSDAEFCIVGDEPCHICHPCLRAISKATKEGQVIKTREELMEARREQEQY